MTLRLLRALTAFAALLVLGLTVAAQQPSYPCYRAPASPVVDGDVEADAAWLTVPAVTGFRVLGGGYTRAKQTVARACWDDEAVYVAFVCEEPDAAALAPSIRDWGPTWSEDSIEVFLQSRDAGPVYQFGVTAGGARGSGESAPDILRCAAAARISADSYSIELRVPYEVLRCERPRAGVTWRGAFCRNIFVTTSGGDKFTDWPALQRRFLEPENFADLVFLEETLDAASATALTDRLSADYRATVLTELRAAAARGDEYEDALRRAAGDKEFAGEARVLLRQWRRIERLDRRADEAPLGEIRKALTTAEGLVAASHELKYDFLIAELFRED